MFPIRSTSRPLGRTGQAATTGSSRPVGELVEVAARFLAVARRIDRWTEVQHWFGQHNDPLTSPIPANEHRVLSELQARWPKDTLRNPDGSPLLRAAAALRSWLDVMRLLIERVVAWIPPFLEQLDSWLRDRLGPRWWDGFAGGSA
jgi:hypothetical protein